MKDAQKAYKNSYDGEGEKVHIPETFEDFDLDSESFGQRLKNLAGMGDSSKGGQGESSRHLWIVRNDVAVEGCQKPTGEKGNSVTISKIFEVASQTVSLSPEVFIPDDGIINTQGSIEMEVGENEKVTYLSALEMESLTKEVEAEKMEVWQDHERRRSDRLKKTTTMTTMEKNLKMAKKGNLEGNPSSFNCFSVLLIEEMVNVTSNMGIDLNENDFDTFNLLKDLEKARDDLYYKQINKASDPQTESVEDMQANKASLVLEWIQEESSEIDEFILVESRKRKKKIGRMLKSLSLSKGKS
jgi:hypothetical protein